MPNDADNSTAHLTSSNSLTQAMENWKLYLQDQGRTNFTIKAFLGDMNLLINYLPPDQTLGSITTNDLNNFLNWLQHGRGVPCSPKSLARRITTLKSFFKWLNGSGVILADPAEKLVQKTVQSPLPAVLTREEKEAVLEAAKTFKSAKKPDTRHHALLLLLLETGIKKSECRGIDLNHLAVEDTDEPYVFIRYTTASSRYKERKINVSDEWVASLNEYLAQYQPQDKLFRWSARQLEYLLEDVAEKAAIDKRLSFDTCRWTCAVSDWNAGMDHDLIRQKLGISKIQWREVSNKLRLLADKY